MSLVVIILLLAVRATPANAVPGGGAIGGTVTCNSTHTVFVDLWMSDTTTPPPDKTVKIACGEVYSFTLLAPGTYYVDAWIDLNESADGPPDPGEPIVWYDNQSPVTIGLDEIKSNINITIKTEYAIFLPLISK